jgi:hypothetical protein
MSLSAALPQPLCADNRSFSLHAAMSCAPHECQRHEQLCRHITRPSMANERAQVNSAGQVVSNQDRLARRHHAHRDVAAGVHAMSGCSCAAVLVARAYGTFEARNLSGWMSGMGRHAAFACVD